jgi:hypothetical protein
LSFGVYEKLSNLQAGDHSERRRILVAPSELEEQRGCAVLAFREWLAPLAFKTERALVVPSRFSTLFNFTTVAEAWKDTCGLKDVIHEPGVYAKHYEQKLCAPESPTSFHLRIEKDWRGGGGGAPLRPCPEKKGPAMSNNPEDLTNSKRRRLFLLNTSVMASGGAHELLLSPPSPSPRRQLLAGPQHMVESEEEDEQQGGTAGSGGGSGSSSSGVDRCLVLRGRASLFELVKQVGGRWI